jgi:hypothetical protein
MNKMKNIFMKFFCVVLLIFSVQTQFCAEKPWSWKYPILFFVTMVGLGVASNVQHFRSVLKKAQNKQDKPYQTRPISRWEIFRSFFKKDEQHYQGEKVPKEPLITIKDPKTGEKHELFD